MTVTRALVVIAMVTAATLEAQQRFEYHKDIPNGGRVAIRNIIGDVRIEPGSGRTLQVSAIKRAGHHGNPEDVEIQTVELADGVAICVVYPSSGWSSGRSSRRHREADGDDEDRPRRRSHDDPCHRDGNWNGNNRNDTSVEFTLKVPAAIKLDAKTVSGDVIATGLRGEIEVASVSGNVEVKDMQGDLLDATTVSGDVELNGIKAREISAETVSGGVTFAGPIDPKGSYNFKTLSGDVVLRLPGQPDAELVGATFSGDLDSDFPTSGNSRKNRRHRFNATWGSGSAKIEVESFSGDVRIVDSGRSR